MGCPVVRAASTSAHCATPTLVHWQPPINSTAGRIPFVLSRALAVQRSLAVQLTTPLLSSRQGLRVRAHTRPATAVSYPALHCMHLLCLNLVAVCVFPGLRHRHRRRVRCCCFPEFPDWLVLLLGVTDGYCLVPTAELLCCVSFVSSPSGFSQSFVCLLLFRPNSPPSSCRQCQIQSLVLKQFVRSCNMAKLLHLLGILSYLFIASSINILSLSFLNCYF